MSIPDFQSIMLPLLNFSKDQKEHSLRESIEALANEFKLTDQERKKLLPTGQQAIFDNRVAWARTYMKKAGLLNSTRRAYFMITEQGLDVLRQKPKEIDAHFLKQFPKFIEFQKKRDKNEEQIEQDTNNQTPNEAIEIAYQKIRQDLANELLQTIKDRSPKFFEKLVIDLLIKMGYGGTKKDAGEAIGKSRDGGIDGFIKEDRLGLDVVYIQAKCWDNTTVSRPEIQKFAGALQGHRARKGIFITTSTFTKDAHDYVSRIDSKIVLIDGNQLAQLMIDFNIGVNVIASYELKKADSDYFNED